jgi:hypothetical protein
MTDDYATIFDQIQGPLKDSHYLRYRKNNNFMKKLIDSCKFFLSSSVYVIGFSSHYGNPDNEKLLEDTSVGG